MRQSVCLLYSTILLSADARLQSGAIAKGSFDHLLPVFQSQCLAKICHTSILTCLCYHAGASLGKSGLHDMQEGYHGLAQIQIMGYAVATCSVEGW